MDPSRRKEEEEARKVSVTWSLPSSTFLFFFFCSTTFPFLLLSFSLLLPNYPKMWIFFHRLLRWPSSQQSQQHNLWCGPSSNNNRNRITQWNPILPIRQRTINSLFPPSHHIYRISIPRKEGIRWNLSSPSLSNHHHHSSELIIIIVLEVRIKITVIYSRVTWSDTSFVPSIDSSFEPSTCWAAHQQQLQTWFVFVCTC